MKEELDRLRICECIIVVIFEKLNACRALNLGHLFAFRAGKKLLSIVHMSVHLCALTCAQIESQTLKHAHVCTYTHTNTQIFIDFECMNYFFLIYVEEMINSENLMFSFLLLFIHKLFSIIFKHFIAESAV